MARWLALSRLTLLPSTTIHPGETAELEDRVAIILLNKGRIRPAIRNVVIPDLELEEYEHGTDTE